MDIRSEIMNQFSQVAREQGRDLGPLNDAVELYDSGLDSLCFAIIVARLEGSLGLDPFSAAENEQFPITFGQFVKFYENASA